MGDEKSNISYKEIEEGNSNGPKSARLARIDPPFIRYLFQSTTKDSCVFLVGDQNVEQIVAIKHILMAHSEAFRLMLEDSALAEKGAVKVPDIEPETFKNLLRFVYGNDILSTMDMKEAVDLIYVAEKYMITELKPKLSSHIRSILTSDNVLIPLQKPACFTQELLKQAINQNIQNFTDSILKHEEFLDINMFGLLNILQQDCLAVPEIELWQSVLRWVKHNASSDNWTVSRELLRQPLKYLRLCTLTLEDFCKEVAATKLLSAHEVSEIVYSIVSKVVSNNLKTVCNTIETRNISGKRLNRKDFRPYFHQYSCQNKSIVESQLSIITKSSPVIMKSALFKSDHHWILGETQNLKFLCECKIVVKRIDYSSSKWTMEPVVEIDFKKNLSYGKEFEIPFVHDNNYITLFGNNKYMFSFTFKRLQSTKIKYFSSNYEKFTDFNALNTVELGFCVHGEGKRGSHILEITYESVN